MGHNASVRVTAKVDYAVRAAIVLASHEGEGPVKGDRVAEAQDIPLKYLENILAELRQSGIVRSQRGADGGYWLARPASQITLAEIIRAVEGPLAHVRGERPTELRYPAGAGALAEVWVAVRASLRTVLDGVTLAQVRDEELPDQVRALLDDPGAYEPS